MVEQQASLYHHSFESFETARFEVWFIQKKLFSRQEIQGGGGVDYLTTALHSLYLTTALHCKCACVCIVKIIIDRHRTKCSLWGGGGCKMKYTCVNFSLISF